MQIVIFAVKNNLSDLNFYAKYLFFFFSDFFENLLRGKWKPFLGFSHSKKIDFGNGKPKFSHGFNFNLGPQPTFNSKDDYYKNSVDLLMQQDTNEATKNVLRTMTVPLKEKRNPKKTNWWNR